jgi:hypothetical protein
MSKDSSVVSATQNWSCFKNTFLSIRQSLWRTWFAASTHPILLRMGPQTLKVPYGTVLVLTIRFARSSSCHGPCFELCSGWTLVVPLERCGRWHTNTTLRHTLMEHNIRHTLMGHDTTPYTYGAWHYVTHLWGTTLCHTLMGHNTTPHTYGAQHYATHLWGTTLRHTLMGYCDHMVPNLWNPSLRKASPPLELPNTSNIEPVRSLPCLESVMWQSTCCKNTCKI